MPEDPTKLVVAKPDDDLHAAADKLQLEMTYAQGRLTELQTRLDTITADKDADRVVVLSQIKELVEEKDRWQARYVGMKAAVGEIQKKIAARLGDLEKQKRELLNVRTVDVNPHHKLEYKDPEDPTNSQLIAALLKEPRGMIDTVLKMADGYPQSMALLYPRIYPNVSRYFSPKIFAAHTVIHLVHAAEIGLTNAPIATKLMVPGLSYAVEHQMPYMFITPELMDAVQRTDFKDDIDWPTIELPFDAGVFVLPRGSLVHPKDGEVGFIYYSRIGAGEYHTNKIVPGMGRAITNELAFSIVALCPANGVIFDSNLTMARPKLRLNNLFYRNIEAGEVQPQIGGDGYYDEQEIGEEDQGFIEKLGVVVFGTLLALRARPALLTPAVREKVVKAAGNKPKREFWEPCYIGKGYYPKREGAKGTHASPRMHWRRGHFRQQAFGPKLSERKVIWLEPCLVSAKIGEEKSVVKD